jgi:four helix bundle protein
MMLGRILYLSVGEGPHWNEGDATVGSVDALDMNPISSSTGFAISGYRDLELWKSAMELALAVLKLADGPLLSRRRSLCDQISRAAVSIPSNIAEGNERGTNKDSIRFLYIARGSAAELSTQLELALGVGAITPAEHADLQAQLSKVFRLLGGMLKMRQARLDAEKRPK